MKLAEKEISGAALAPERKEVLSVQDLTVSVRSANGLTPLVSNLSFSISKGETLAIAGESGSGKSITSLAIMGLLPPPAVRVTGGKINLGEVELTKLPEAEMQRYRGDRIAMIFQEPMTSLNPIMTIGQQLTEALEAHEDLPRKEVQARVLEALRAVRISEPERRLRQYPHELSGGMRQRVMIAMAIALKPDVLIADEPTTALDVTVQREVLNLLRDLQAELGTAIILITHDMGVVAEMADRVIVMQSGRMVEEGSVDGIFRAPGRRYTQDLLAAVPRMGKGGHKRQSKPAEDFVACIDDLSVRFDIRSGLFGRVSHHVHAVHHVSFDIAAGETFAIVGESGCGKSTVAKTMVGLVPFQGDIDIAGFALGREGRDAPKSLRRDVQMIFQDPMASLDPRMKVGDLVAEPLVIHGIGSAQERAERVRYLFNRVGLSDDQIDRYPHEFSGGQRQRICIARSLALQPKLIIADESVSALDVTVQARVLDLLQALKEEFGIAFLFISHDMAVVENIADRVAVMYLGQIVETGSRAQVFGAPQHPYTRRLIEAVPVPDPSFKRPVEVRPSGEVPSPMRAVGDAPKAVKLREVSAGHFVAQ